MTWKTSYDWYLQLHSREQPIQVITLCSLSHGSGGGVAWVSLMQVDAVVDVVVVGGGWGGSTGSSGSFFLKKVCILWHCPEIIGILKIEQ